jgi:cytochrome c peroxidase
MKPLFRGIAILALLTGCGPDQLTDLSIGEDSPDAIGVDSSKLTSAEAKGAELFFKGTFGGNGRTCATCHSGTDGTINPAEVVARFKANPKDSLFRSIDSDDGVGSAYSRLKADATIRVTLPLPANISIAGSSARRVTLNRGVPTTFNTPALDPVLMADGRAPTLEAQALDAIHSHAQNKTEPTATQLQQIAAFEKVLFTNSKLAAFAYGGAAPVLPAGSTASEQRGRAFFEPFGLCGSCHTGPMLNTDVFAGSRFSTAFVSELNLGGQPVHSFVIQTPDGPFTLESPDLGRALITGNPADIGQYKIPQLWGVKATAPYFHDNSAKTLADVVNQYGIMFDIIGLPHMTDQDKADIVAYMKLL